jgi:hypothetical protein
MAVFIKISETFTLSNSKNKDLAPEYKKPIVARFKKIKADTLSLTLSDNYKDVGGIGFKCGVQNKVNGDLLINIDGKNIKIQCDAIFKINIRSQHKEKFLSNKGTWTFGRLQQGEYGDDLVGDVSKGLDVKKYKIKLRHGTENMTAAIMKNVETSSKKTDLK